VRGAVQREDGEAAPWRPAGASRPAGPS